MPVSITTYLIMGEMQRRKQNWFDRWKNKTNELLNFRIQQETLRLRQNEQDGPN